MRNSYENTERAIIVPHEKRIIRWSALSLAAAGLAGCYYPAYQPYPAPSAPAYQASSAPQCRDYPKTVTIDNKPQQTTSTACLQADGTWKDKFDGSPVSLPPVAAVPAPAYMVPPSPGYVYAPPPAVVYPAPVYAAPVGIGVGVRIH